MEELNTKYDKKHINLIRNVFYRPTHPDLLKESGWVAKWQLLYKERFSSKTLYETEEVFKTEDEAKKALKNHTLKELLPNIKEFLLEEI